jgi:hypothetical protein
MASLMPATRRFASSTVSRFVTPNVPPPGTDANAVLSECPFRTSCPLASPTGQYTKSRRACADVSSVLRRVPCRKFFHFALEGGTESEPTKVPMSLARVRECMNHSTIAKAIAG